MKIRSRLIMLLLPGIASTCFAAGGTGEYELPWPHQGEVLMYHSCGCGDACWVAEVRERRSRKVLNRLGCDCSSLSYAAGGQRKRSRPLQESCDEINDSSDKAGRIKSKIEQLRRSAAQMKPD